MLVPNIGHSTVLTIVIAIIVGMFVFQQFGSTILGRAFGPMMLIWFLVIGVVGALHVGDNLSILNAINPYYAYRLITHHTGRFYILGAVFLCTTGAEALDADLDHCGKANIRVHWCLE